MAEVKICSKCNTSIPMPDIISGQAKLLDGKLLCANCAGGGQGASAPETSGAGPIQLSEAAPGPAAAPQSAAAPIAMSSEPVEALKIDEAGDDAEPTQIIARGGLQQRAKVQYKRQPHVSGSGAIRVKTFDAKLTRSAIELMDEQINTWLDETGYEIKFATSTIGDVLSKTTESHLIINIWY
ncbi:MAG: hypothetical protein GWP05_03735 [Anaerolineaceae bacterium]|nr:hypothetical protein [Anaerolineaceae bacterium]